ncbi:unnamed protein product [Closterium sp. Naga37s-1]|nr:unnamed protein product [Closterium sp. Naga37s-1]
MLEIVFHVRNASPFPPSSSPLPRSPPPLPSSHPLPPPPLLLQYPPFFSSSPRARNASRAHQRRVHLPAARHAPVLTRRASVMHRVLAFHTLGRTTGRLTAPPSLPTPATPSLSIPRPKILPLFSAEPPLSPTPPHFLSCACSSQKGYNFLPSLPPSFLLPAPSFPPFHYFCNIPHAFSRSRLCKSVGLPHSLPISVPQPLPLPPGPFVLLILFSSRCPFVYRRLKNGLSMAAGMQTTALIPHGVQPAGKVTSEMRASQVTGSRGDYNSTGTVALAFFKYGETYNIRYSVHVWRLDRPEIPKKATVHYGTRFTTGPVQIEFPSDKWVNMTSNYQRPNRPKLYTYVIAGVWHDVAKVKAANGKSLEPFVLVLLVLLACASSARGKWIGRVSTLLNGAQVVGSTGDLKSTGSLALGLYRFGKSYWVRYSVKVSQAGNSAFPTKATVNAGKYGANGAVQYELPTNWQNRTLTPQPVAKVYNYVLEGVVKNAESITTSSGKTLSVLMMDILKAPRTYYGLVTSPSYPDGAIRGQLHKG